MKTKGFTLVELLVVIAILAILATVSVVGYTSYITRTETTAAETEAASIADAIEVALVLNKNVYVEVGTDSYILIARTATGVTYTAADEVADGYVEIAEIPAGLADGLSVVDGALKYTSDKGVTVDVK